MGAATPARFSAILLLALSVSLPAHAAFPGANGRLVFEHELPASGHTQTDIYTVRPAGSGLERLTATPNRNEFGPAWNSAGTRIAFWRTPAPFGPGSLWVMGSHGGHQRQLTSGFDARDPSWDPQGTRIVFTRSEGSNFNLWTVRASTGSGLRRLTSGRAQDFEPAWSPDGRRIAFTRGFDQGDPGDIYILTLSSGRIHRVTASPAYDHQVTWGPGGRRLVFERDFDSSSSIFAVDADGSHLVRLTRGAHFDVGPAVSPDGHLVAFGSDRGGTALSDLWMIHSDGTGLHRVLQLRFGEGAPDWQPLPR
jgi:Tol biopolymer transport system component